jgi:hypothetical protein
MINELRQIIQELKQVIKEENLNITHSEILDISVRIMNTGVMNKPKQFNNLKNESPKPDFEPPTQAQIKACKKLNITIPEGASKGDVWKLMNKKN